MRLFYLLLVSCLLSGALQAQDLPSCSDNEAIGIDSCVFTWAEHGRRRQFIWHRLTMDNASPYFLYRPQGAKNDGEYQDALRSKRPPMITDIDGDGFRDLLTFKEVGMVNGIFHAFLYEPETDSLLRPFPMYGATLFRDREGYLVVSGRNGARPYYRMYEQNGRQFSLAFEIDPQDECVVLRRGGSADTTLDPDYLAPYCDFTRYAGEEQAWLSHDDTLELLPRNTVFYCEIERGGIYQAFVTREVDHLKYSYGPKGGDTELVFEASFDEFEERNKQDVDGTEHTQFALKNGDFTYSPYFFSREATGNSPTTSAGHSLVVTNAVGTSIFEAPCNAAHSFGLRQNPAVD